MGDFNSRTLSLGDTVENELAPVFREFVDDTGLLICNEEGVFTRKGSKGQQDSILDVSLVSSALEPEVTQWGVFEEFASDHFGVAFELRLPGRTASVTRTVRVWDFAEADWDSFREELGNTLSAWRECVNWEGDINLLCSEFSCMILAAAHNSIPKKTITERSRQRVSKKVMKLRKERKRAVRVRRRTDTEWIRAEISELGKRIKEQTKKDLQERIERFVKGHHAPIRE